MYVTKKLDDFDTLVCWFEVANDPWFYEKKTSFLGKLGAFQEQFSPCANTNNALANIIINRSADETERLLDVMRRANKIQPHTVSGYTIVPNGGSGRSTWVPAKHHDIYCVCVSKSSCRYMCTIS
jgi:hypothetical protein